MPPKEPVPEAVKPNDAKPEGSKPATTPKPDASKPEAPKAPEKASVDTALALVDGKPATPADPSKPAAVEKGKAKTDAPVDPTTGKTASVEQTIGAVQKQDVKKFETDNKTKKDAALQKTVVEVPKDVKIVKRHGTKGDPEY